ncbi:hypothetical protein ALI144C_37105 [Actinosynnema sp. ALI-1.44]|nr:hypothetical protein ALI144C_37105 [Actinosynnema sp. ALI-1.44]
MAVLDRDIVERLAGEWPDMTIVSEDADLADVDVLLVPEADSLAGYLSLMWAHRQLGVVMVDPAGGLVWVCRVAVPTWDAGTTWEQHLAEAIRSAADPARMDKASLEK